MAPMILTFLSRFAPQMSQEHEHVTFMKDCEHRARDLCRYIKEQEKLLLEAREKGFIPETKPDSIHSFPQCNPLTKGGKG